MLVQSPTPPSIPQLPQQPIVCPLAQEPGCRSGIIAGPPGKEQEKDGKVQVLMAHSRFRWKLSVCCGLHGRCSGLYQLCIGHQAVESLHRYSESMM